MNQSRSLSDLSVTEVRKVLAIKEQIAQLEEELNSVLGGSSSSGVNGGKAHASSNTPTPKRRGRPPGKRKVSEESGERQHASEPVNGAKAHASSNTPTPKRRGRPPGSGKGARQMSAEARERISSAQRARWAAKRGGSEVAASAAAPSGRAGGKRGGRRQLSPEARERIAAAQRARWAASRKGR